MKRVVVIMIFMLSVLLSSCEEQEVEIEQQSESNKVDELSSTLEIDLQKDSFSEIYNFSKNFFIDDVYIHNPDRVNNGTQDVKLESTDQFDVVHELFNLECSNSTINDVVYVENNYDYIVDFKLSNAEGARSFSVSIGDSYLLVSLISETEKIIKHDIAQEDYENLLELLYQEPDKGMEVVEENLVRVTNHIPITPDETGYYLKYLVLHDSDLNRIPLLARVELSVNDLGKEQPVMKSIELINIDLFGATSIETIGEFTDGNYYWEKMLVLSNDESISTLARSRVPEIKYLESNFSDVTLWNKFQDVITYSSSYPISNYTVSIGIGRDPVTDALYLNVNDNNQ